MHTVLVKVSFTPLIFLMTFLLNHTCIKIRSKSKLPMRSPNPTVGDEYKTVSGPFFARALLKRNNMRVLSAG